VVRKVPIHQRVVKKIIVQKKIVGRSFGGNRLAFNPTSLLIITHFQTLRRRWQQRRKSWSHSARARPSQHQHPEEADWQQAAWPQEGQQAEVERE
jgi:hypothetical protein